MTALLAAVLLLIGCSDDVGALEPPRELRPVANPFGPEDPLWAPQPHREKPAAIVADPARGRVYVALTGTEEEPGRQIAVVDASSLSTLARVDVGPGPIAMAVHPGGRHLVVLNRFARHASVVDLDRLRVTAEIEVPFYCEAIAFDASGERALVGHRHGDRVVRWRVRAEGSRFEVDSEDAPELGPRAGLSVPANPRRIVALPGGGWLVTSETEMALTRLEADASRVAATYRPNAPVLDVAVVGAFAYVLHTGHGSGHPPADGFDGDGDGAPGDGTANVTFQDVQNEITVLSLPGLEPVHEYTSDSICCRDYRDVDPDRPDVGAELAPRDAWPAERVAFMPPRPTWIVAGAMPERAVPFRRADGSDALAVVFGGSSEVQTFDVDADGALAPRETAASGLHATGLGAVDAVEVDGRLLVVDRLSETLTAIELDGPPAAERVSAVVGDVGGGDFPATDVELGEAFNTVTAPFSVDGDQTCIHCHRDGTPIAKPVSMPLLDDPDNGVRLVMSYRGAYDTRPWFVEAAMDEQNFFPVINELARKENFCCEQRDPRVWSRYPTQEQCLADRALDGCRHVLECLDDPPPECADRGYGGETLTRDEHFRRAARRVLGRDTSFGDGLWSERLGPDGQIVRRPINLGFDGITRALGLFLLSRPRRLPNPNAVAPSALALRGEAIYHSSEAGCATCHPLPVTATARPTVATEAPGPTSFPYLVSPLRHPLTGADVDITNAAFLGTFPDARQDAGGLRVGVPAIRGSWDRERFFHHGAARTLHEALATPGHPALRSGEVGRNEREGQPNTHGGTSQLDAEDLDALVAFVETL